MMYKSLCKET
jgi:hypothetical protein